MPAIGYFVFNKAALGLKVGLNLTKDKYLLPNGSENATSQNNLGVGPFLRYYFLPVGNRVNAFSEANVFYTEVTNQSGSNSTNKTKELVYSLLGGLVVFLNSSVGVEFSLGYYNSKVIDFDSRGEDFKFGIGIQIHLEKDKP